MGFATNAIHVGQEPDSATGAIVLPIYQTSTYVQEELGKDKGFDYARTNHPNRKALEKTLAKLEGGHAAYVFTSGMAAIDSVFRLLRPGDHVVLSEAVYGGVYRIATQLLVHFGLEFSFVDTSSPDLVLAAMRANTRMLYIETPTNPTLRITDIAGMVKLATERNPILVVDNTFLPPYLQSPISLGAHIVVHSMTKYLNGHSDCTGGCVVVTRQEEAEKIYFIQRSAGAGLSPMDCFLVSRGLKTLAVRMLQHNANGIPVARHPEAPGEHFADFGVGVETPRYRDAVGVVLGHAHGEGFGSARDQKTIQRRKGGAGGTLNEIDFLGFFLARDDYAAAGAVAVAVEVFGHGVDNNVGAQSDGALQIGSQKSIVDDEYGVALSGELGHGGNVRDPKSGISGSFDVQHAGVGPHGGED